MTRAIILHASQDQHYAETFAQVMRLLLPDVEFDHHDNVGAFLLDGITLAPYDAMIVLVSPEAMASPAVVRVLAVFGALKRDGIRPVMLRPASLPEFLDSSGIIHAEHLTPGQLADEFSRPTLSTWLHTSRQDDGRTPSEEEPIEEERVTGMIPPPASAPPPPPGGLPVGQPAPQQPPAPAPGYAPPDDTYASAPQAAPYYDYGQPYAEPPLARGGDRSTVTERPQFTAYHPNETPVAAPQTLVVYMHLAAQRSQVQADAGTFAELGSAPTTTQGQALRQVPHNVEMTVEPHVEGVTFSPPRDSFIWRGEWHRSLFRYTGTEQLAGVKQRGWIDVYADRVSPICTLDVEFSFHAGIPTASLSVPRGMAVTANAFDTVFISYSHRDREPMRQAQETYQKLGVTTYHDDLLRAGDNYERELAKMIRAANIFHLLWSNDAAHSAEVRKEWLLALSSQKGERFIRPWYWQQPIAPPPEELRALKLSFRYEHLRRRLLNPSTWF